jgi:hypothetical protein
VFSSLGLDPLLAYALSHSPLTNNAVTKLLEAVVSSGGNSGGESAASMLGEALFEGGSTINKQQHQGAAATSFLSNLATNAALAIEAIFDL